MRVYLDTMVWIYWLEGDPKFGVEAQSIFQRLRAANHTLLVSHFLLAELLVVPVQKNDLFSITSYRRMMLGSSNTEVISFTESVAMQFAWLRAMYRTAPADSIHLALASSAGADIFLTNDTRLSKLTIPGIGTICDLQTSLI